MVGRIILPNSGSADARNVQQLICLTFYLNSVGTVLLRVMETKGGSEGGNDER
jgi:hypothetical protein